MRLCSPSFAIGAGRHLVAADRERNPRPVGPARGRRRHRRAAGRPGRSAARSEHRTRGWKARSPAWSSTSCRAEARFSGPQLIFSQISGTHAGRRLDYGQRNRRFRRRPGRAQPRLQRQQGAAARSRRHRRASHRADPHPLGRQWRHDFRQAQARQGPLPARPGERGGGGAAAQGARDRPRSGRSDRDRRSCIRGSSTSSVAAAN